MNALLEHPSQQAVTVRVVFDGAPFAGKTTAARSLSAAMAAETVTQNEEDGRTVWFDWMSYSGGQYEGQPIRVELVTVPGQQHLANRRRHLVAWGDVVVFIADSSAAEFATSVDRFADLRGDLAARPEVPVVVVANKRDLEDAVPVLVVRDRLGLSDSEWLVEAVATAGGGVQEALIYAVREAIECSATRHEPTSPDELLSELRALPAPSDTMALELAPSTDMAVSEAKETADLVLIGGARLNEDGVAEGRAVVLTDQHWRLLVKIADGCSEVSFADPDEAATALELATWGLIVNTPATADRALPLPRLPLPTRTDHDC